jgi:single-strand DNA-binding protein
MARRKSTTTEAPAPEITPEAPAKQDSVTLVGRLCADPVLRHTQSGKAVTTIRLAVNKAEADTEFHSVVVWGRTAQVVCEYMRKGRAVEVTGRTQERSYTAADGTDRQVTEIVAWRVQFLNREQLAEAQPATEKEVA